MLDVLVVGAGPAGSVTATVLARQGARVLLVDRARFPRDKLCGDTINPGALADLRRLDMAAAALDRGVRLDGMLLTGEGRVTVRGVYGRGRSGRAVPRRELDAQLVREAIRAGARFEEGVRVEEPITADGPDGPVVTGAVVRSAGGAPARVRARVTIGADGRQSRLARAVGLGRPVRRPRRWAVGAYMSGVEGMGSYGEMHVRRKAYVGVAPLPGGLTNVCLVSAGWRPGPPGDRLVATLMRDRRLRVRFASAAIVGRVSTLGPLAWETSAPGVRGLLLAGDAGRFIDPMTGDGIRFAVKGGELAAQAAIAVLGGDMTALERLRRWRRTAFDRKWRFNRALRGLVATPLGVRGAGALASIAPVLFERMIAYAGDVDCGETEPPGWAFG